MVTTQSADSVLKSYYLGVVADHIDTEYVRKYGRESTVENRITNTLLRHLILKTDRLPCRTSLNTANGLFLR